MPDLLPFASIADGALLQVGGKGLSLARTAAAGLPVPPGFVVTTDAYRRLFRSGIASDAGFVEALNRAYRELGGGCVAVRSSATAEDGAETSFAGQQETILGVTGEEDLATAVERCWKSLYTERSLAYRRQQGIADDGAAMAVVVQRLIPADVAGVLFTRDPQDATGENLSVEASWGLGEAVVSGRVTPDRYRVNLATGIAVEKHAGQKTVEFTANGERLIEGARQTDLCLRDSDLSALAELARRVEACYGAPRDIEWAIASGTLYLLQARPITTATAAERETLRQATAAELGRIADPKGTVWVKFGIGEVLPEPTPLTWDLIRRMLAQDGGFGAMNRDLGASPDATLGSDSAFDLVAGRPMMNLSRLPRMQFARAPFEYPFAKFKADPKLALTPAPTLLGLGGLGGVVRLPVTVWRLWRMNRVPRMLVATYPDCFLNEVVPPFVKDAKAALAQDWSALPSAGVLALLHEWTERTLVDFARESLKATVLADLAWSNLFNLLQPKLGDERANAALAELSQGAKPPADAALADGIKAFAAGTLSEADFVERFGHRGRNEMELAQPRWSEVPAALAKLRGTATPVARTGLDNLAAKIDAIGKVSDDDLWKRVANEARLVGHPRLGGAKTAANLRVLLGLREAAKHYFLLGYAVMRRALVELDTRFKLNGGIFSLMRDELPQLIDGKDFAALIAARKRARQLALSLEVPALLFSDDLDAIGRAAPAPDGATILTGVALSAGVAEGSALVLTEPTDPPDEPFVLVCPSTDPAWVPLFAKARALIMETGGVLSHGAIVAREFGLPAVAGLPGVVRALRSGQKVRVDGSRGTVTLV